MVPRKIVLHGDTARALATIRDAVNYGEVVLPFPAVGSEEALAGTNIKAYFGGVTVPRQLFRGGAVAGEPAHSNLLGADDRWLVYAAGWVDTVDAVPVTLSLEYRNNAGAYVALGNKVSPVGGSKLALGPFQVFPTAPKTENIPIVALGAVKAAGGAAVLEQWTVWLRILPSVQ